MVDVAHAITSDDLQHALFVDDVARDADDVGVDSEVDLVDVLVASD